MTKHNNIAGKTFGKLIAVEPVQVSGKGSRKRTLWRFQCQCGDEIIKQASRVVDGHTKSCGCLIFCKYTGVESLEQECFNRNYADGNLEFEDFAKLIRLDCYYCGAQPSNVFKRKNKRNGKITAQLVYNGLDRLDSKKPHDLNNVVPCCIACNKLKSNRHVIDFVNHIKAIYEHMMKGSK